MLNHIELHGRLGRNPELAEKQGQKGPYKRVTFSLAVDRDFGDGCDWFYCVMIGKRAEVIDKYFRKGSEIIVSGRMESYKPKNNPDQTAWLVKMSGFDFAGSNNSTGSNSAPNEANGEIPDSFEEAEDDIPF